MRPQLRNPAWVWVACLGLIVLKLQLTASQTVTAIGSYTYDDLHFISQAAELLQGHWLGPYDQLTLIKGPLFPAWIALASASGVPLLLSAQLLYAAACLLFMVAVGPQLSRNLYTLILFAYMLFNPMSANVLRVIRELISPGLTVLVAACAVALLLREHDDRKALWWSAGLGASFAALWLNREEEMVVLPFLVFAFAAALLRPFEAGSFRARGRVVRVWSLAGLIWAVIVYAVAAANFAAYGIFAKTEFEAPSYKAAYAALLSVSPAELKPLVPVTAETRGRIYKASPAFSELEPFLEGDVGSFWESVGRYMQTEANRGEILSAWFGWAFRDAVSEAGYYATGRYPDEYYSRLASEIREACNRHILQCHAPRPAYLPAMGLSELRSVLATFGERLKSVLMFAGVETEPAPSSGAPRDLERFRAMTRTGTTAPRDYYIQLRAAARNLPPLIVVKDPRERANGFASDQAPDPELHDLLIQRGRDFKEFNAATYTLYALCSDECSLQIWVGGHKREDLQFSELRSNQKIVVLSDLAYQILDFAPPPHAPPPAEAREVAAEAIRLQTILRVYQLVSPVLAIIALLSYELLTIRLLRFRERGRAWLLLTGLGVLVVSRIGLVSLLHVTILRVRATQYVEATYPIALAFVGISCLVGLESIKRTWRKRAERQRA